MLCIFSKHFFIKTRIRLYSKKMSTYLESSKGKFIPATKRPDGTWRKERRVKDGYIPQEEVPLYESKGKQFVSQRQTGVPPGMCPVIAAEMKKAREKKEKLKVNKVEKDTTPKTKSCAIGTSKPTKHIEPAKESEVALITKTLDDGLTLNDTNDVNISKQIKKLRKKIREIEQIENKIESGSINTLDKDQLDKVKKKPDILKQLRSIEENSTAVLRT